MPITFDLLSSYKQNAAFVLVGVPNAIIRIKDIEHLWATSSTGNNVVFHTGYRLAGTRANIRTVLIELGTSDELINNIMLTVISYTNYITTHRDIYNLEKELYNEYILSSFNKSITFNYVPLSNNNATIVNNSAIPNVTSNVTTSLELVDSDIFDDATGDIDIFDFVTYNEEYELFQQFFQGPELYIRTANWIHYKYVRLATEDERAELAGDLMMDRNSNYRTTNGTINWLKTMTDMFEPEQILWSWYKHFKPYMLDNVPGLYEKWSHHFGVFFNKLYTRYVDANHQDQTLWF